MKSINLNDADAPLNDYARNLGDEPLLLTQDGRTVAALLPVGEADLDAQSLACSSQFASILDEARRQRRAGEAVSSQDVRRKLGLS